MGCCAMPRRSRSGTGSALPVAYQTDVPGCVAGTVDALADAGVKYLAVAHNWAGRSVPYLGDGSAAAAVPVGIAGG